LENLQIPIPVVSVLAIGAKCVQFPHTSFALFFCIGITMYCGVFCEAFSKTRVGLAQRLVLVVQSLYEFQRIHTQSSFTQCSVFMIWALAARGAVGGEAYFKSLNNAFIIVRVYHFNYRLSKLFLSVCRLNRTHVDI
jgi:hypothetical protein